MDRRLMDFSLRIFAVLLTEYLKMDLLRQQNIDMAAQALVDPYADEQDQHMAIEQMSMVFGENQMLT